jgi:hypothetical protein
VHALVQRVETPAAAMKELLLAAGTKVQEVLHMLVGDWACKVLPYTKAYFGPWGAKSLSSSFAGHAAALYSLMSPPKISLRWMPLVGG